MKIAFSLIALCASAWWISNTLKDDPTPAAHAVPKPRPDGMTPTTQPANSATRPAMEDKQMTRTEKAMFGAGCFWGVEARFRAVPGVVATAVGFAGGKTKNPSYKDVCTDTTGHAEVVLIEFDPARVTYDQLLDIFFTSHDPTQVNRQGPDFGTQYRSVVFFFSPEQEKSARAAAERYAKSGRWNKPIATQFEKAGEFYRAEEYHQQYLEKRGMASCHIEP